MRVEFDPNVVTYDELLTVFWDRLKDPTDAGGQGNDRGLSYTTAIFFEDDEQRRSSRAAAGEVPPRDRDRDPAARQWWPQRSRSSTKELGQSAANATSLQFGAMADGPILLRYFPGDARGGAPPPAGAVGGVRCA